MNISFVSVTCISQSQICFSKGGFNCCQWNLYSHGHAFIQQMNKFFCNDKNFTFIHWLIPVKAYGQINEVYVMHVVQLIQLYNVFTSNLHYLCPMHWCVCFHATCCSIISAACCIIFFNCFHAFLCCSHCFLLLRSTMTSTTCCYVISVILIHSYKIPLYVWY
jgi:hypothetical protein